MAGRSRTTYQPKEASEQQSDTVSRLCASRLQLQPHVFSIQRLIAPNWPPRLTTAAQVYKISERQRDITGRNELDVDILLTWLSSPSTHDCGEMFLVLDSRQPNHCGGSCQESVLKDARTLALPSLRIVSRESGCRTTRAIALASALSASSKSSCIVLQAAE